MTSEIPELPTGSPDTGVEPPRPRGSGARTTLLLGLALGGALLVGAFGVSVLGDQRAPEGDGGVLIESRPALEDRAPATTREPLPDVPLEGFGGEDAPAVDLAAYRGAPLVVNFWASWCVPCVEEMPDFQRFSQERGAEVALLGVNVQDAPANAQAFVEELGITYDLASDPGGDLYTAVRGFGMPTTLLVDPEGTIVYRHTGPLDAEALGALVDEHLLGAAR